MGYTGGNCDNPTYHRLSDHSEAIQVEYDPKVLKYEDLLNHFWNQHDPTSPSWSSQYKKAVFYHDKEQEELAQKSISSIQSKLNKKVHTTMGRLKTFYLAEGYHQKYYLQSEPELSMEVRAYYPDFSDFINSTAASRINGLIAGYGSVDLLSEELNGYGLSPRGRDILIRMVR